MRISDWSADVCSSDLPVAPGSEQQLDRKLSTFSSKCCHGSAKLVLTSGARSERSPDVVKMVHRFLAFLRRKWGQNTQELSKNRSEEHTSELQSLMRLSYAVFCLKKKNQLTNTREPLAHRSDHTRNTHSLIDQTLQHIAEQH